MKKLDNERMPWPNEYFGLHVSRPSTLAIEAPPEPTESQKKAGRAVAERVYHKAEVRPLDELSARDMRRAKFLRQAGLMGPVYGGDGNYLVTAPGRPYIFQRDTGWWVSLTGLRQWMRKLEDELEKELHGKSTEEYGRCLAG